MIVASLLLVIAAAVTLLIGLFNRPDIEWVYASIACCLLAGLLLTVGVLRSRPSRKPVLQSGGQGQGASWAGASTWGGAAPEGTGGDAAVLPRDEDEEQAQTTALQGDDEPTRTSLPAAAPAEPAETSPWAPEDEDDTGDVRVVPPPAAEEPAPPAAPAADADEDVVVVPKPSSRNGATAGGIASGAAATGAPLTPLGADADDAAMSPAPAAAGTSEDAARFEQVLSPIAGVGPAKRQAIYRHFGTYRKLRAATPEKLAEVPGVSRNLADRIHQALHSK